MGSKLVLHTTVYGVPKVLYATSLVILGAKVKFWRRKPNSRAVSCFERNIRDTCLLTQIHVRVDMFWTKRFPRFGSKLYRQIVGIPMGTNCAPLVADLFLFC